MIVDSLLLSQQESEKEAPILVEALVKIYEIYGIMLT